MKKNTASQRHHSFLLAFGMCSIDMGMTFDAGTAPLDRHNPLDLASILSKKVDRINIPDFDSRRRSDRGGTCRAIVAAPKTDQNSSPSLKNKLRMPEES